MGLQMVPNSEGKGRVANSENEKMKLILRILMTKDLMGASPSQPLVFD